MAVYLFTFHSYRSWREDNPRGYVQRGRSGVQSPNEKLAKHREQIATHSPVLFNDDQKRLLIESARDREFIGGRGTALPCGARARCADARANRDTPKIKSSEIFRSSRE
jgi:hypothetical protein